MRIFKHIKDIAQGKTTIKKPRSNHWPKVRDKHLAKHPYCAVCEGTIKLEVHHIDPFHINPEKELDPTNLITLCESKKHGVVCHLLFGHKGNYKNCNPEVERDSSIWNRKLGG